MTVLEFFGCSFIAFGPPLVMFYLTISSDPVRIIILIASAFFWLLSLLLSSLVWISVVSYIGTIQISAIISVLFQEAFRFIIYLILRNAENGLKKVTDSDTQLVDNKHILAYVAGLGFGVMSGAFALVNLLADSVGPGSVGIRGGGDSPLFLVTSSITTLCFILLNTCWGVIFFYSLDKKRYFLTALVVVLHVTASLLTLLNKSNSYWGSIVPNYGILVLSSFIAFKVAGGKMSSRVFSLSTNVPTTVPVVE